MKLKNKLLALLCAVALMASALPAALADGFVITVDSVEMAAADSATEVAVTMTMVGNPGIAGGMLAVTYDSKLTLKAVENGPALEGVDFTPSGKLDMNPFNLLWTNVDNVDGNGLLVTLTFEVPAGAGEYPISIEAIPSFFDKDGVDQALTLVDGKITMQAAAPADGGSSSGGSSGGSSSGGSSSGGSSSGGSSSGGSSSGGSSSGGSSSGGESDPVTPATEPADAFHDVARGAWYREAVNYVVANGVMAGYSADTFGPDNTLTRAMVVQVLYNKENKPQTDDPNPFTDVPADQWYFNAVRWGAARNVVAGFGGNVFKPDDNVTIEQVAVILHNYSGKPEGSGDAAGLGSHSDWAEPALRWAVEKGILASVPFDAVTGPATRAQTAQMLTNYLK